MLRHRLGFASDDDRTIYTVWMRRIAMAYAALLIAAVGSAMLRTHSFASALGQAQATLTVAALDAFDR